MIRTVQIIIFFLAIAVWQINEMNVNAAKSAKATWSQWRGPSRCDRGWLRGDACIEPLSDFRRCVVRRVLGHWLGDGLGRHRRGQGQVDGAAFVGEH